MPTDIVVLQREQTEFPFTLTSMVFPGEKSSLPVCSPGKPASPLQGRKCSSHLGQGSKNLENNEQSHLKRALGHASWGRLWDHLPQHFRNFLVPNRTTFASPGCDSYKLHFVLAKSWYTTSTSMSYICLNSSICMLLCLISRILSAYKMIFHFKNIVLKYTVTLKHFKPLMDILEVGNYEIS